MTKGDLRMAAADALLSQLNEICKKADAIYFALNNSNPQRARTLLEELERDLEGGLPPRMATLKDLLASSS